MMSYGMVDPREIRARLDTPAVRIFMQRGYTIDLIKEVIEEKLRTTGDDFHTMTELALALNAATEKRKISQQRQQLASDTSYMVVLPQSSGNNVGLATASEENSEMLKSWERDDINVDDDDDNSEAGCEFVPHQLYKNDDVEKILEENRELREARQCKMCLDADIAVVILPCGHACTCSSCVTAVTHCPICRMYIRGTVKIAP